MDALTREWRALRAYIQGRNRRCRNRNCSMPTMRCGSGERLQGAELEQAIDYWRETTGERAGA